MSLFPLFAQIAEVTETIVLIRPRLDSKIQRALGCSRAWTVDNGCAIPHAVSSSVALIDREVVNLQFNFPLSNWQDRR
jgi:hypothetical protein